MKGVGKVTMGEGVGKGEMGGGDSCDSCAVFVFQYIS